MPFEVGLNEKAFKLSGFDPDSGGGDKTRIQNLSHLHNFKI